MSTHRNCCHRYFLNDVGPGEEGENPSSGADVRFERRELGRRKDLGGPLEPLLNSCSGDDVVAISKAECGLQRSLVVPETVEVVAQTFELGGRGRVVTLRKLVPQLGPPLADLLDLLVDVSQGHVG